MLIRLFVHQKLGVREPCVLNREAVHYLLKVMRCTVGAHITVFNGEGGEYTAELVSLERDGGLCNLLTFHDVDRELPMGVHIIQAANRSDKLEHVLQKGTELGAAGFCLCVSERMSFRLSGVKLEKRLQRWGKIIIEAAEQSGRTLIPSLEWCAHLNDLPKAKHPAFYLHPDTDHTLNDYFPEIKLQQKVSLAIGPEGGWSGKDMQLLQQHEFQSITLGPRIMRTETAAPAILAALQTLSDSSF